MYNHVWCEGGSRACGPTAAAADRGISEPANPRVSESEEDSRKVHRDDGRDRTDRDGSATTPLSRRARAALSHGPPRPQLHPRNASDAHRGAGGAPPSSRAGWTPERDDDELDAAGRARGVGEPLEDLARAASPSPATPRRPTCGATCWTCRRTCSTPPRRRAPRPAAARAARAAARAARESSSRVGALGARRLEAEERGAAHEVRERRAARPLVVFEHSPSSRAAGTPSPSERSRAPSAAHREHTERLSRDERWPTRAADDEERPHLRDERLVHRRLKPGSPTCCRTLRRRGEGFTSHRWRAASPCVFFFDLARRRQAVRRRRHPRTAKPPRGPPRATTRKNRVASAPRGLPRSAATLEHAYF